MRFIDLTDRRFGRLTVIERIHRGDLQVYWKCRCDCGNALAVNGNKLRNGEIKSCGCLRREVTADRSTTHGMSRTSIYLCWVNLHDRCLNPKNKSYARYGGRGITVCDRWRSFQAFLSDMGPKPEGASIERIDVDGPYSPDNCRWATRIEQMNNTSRNKSISFADRSMTLAQWGREIGCGARAIAHRLRRGWSIEQALTHPFRGRGTKVTYLNVNADVASSAGRKGAEARWRHR